MGEGIKRGLSIGEAAKRIGCGRSKAFELVRTGQLKARKVGARTIILTEDVEALLAALPVVERRAA